MWLINFNDCNNVMARTDIHCTISDLDINRAEGVGLHCTLISQILMGSKKEIRNILKHPRADQYCRSNSKKTSPVLNSIKVNNSVHLYVYSP